MAIIKMKAFLIINVKKTSVNLRQVYDFSSRGCTDVTELIKTIFFFSSFDSPTPFGLEVLTRQH